MKISRCDPGNGRSFFQPYINRTRIVIKLFQAHVIDDENERCMVIYPLNYRYVARLSLLNNLILTVCNKVSSFLIME